MEFKKNSFETRSPPKKKKIGFWLRYYYGTWKWKIFNQTRPLPEEKKILATVLLWYVGLGKNSFVFDPHRKIYIFSFLTTLLLWCTGLQKNVFITLAHLKEKKNKQIVSSCSTRRARNLGKIFIGTLPSLEKIVCGYNTDILHRTWELLFSIMLM